MARRGSGPLMHYTGTKFASHGRAKVYPKWIGAFSAKNLLRERYPILRGYTLTIVNLNKHSRRKNPEKREGLKRAARLLKDFSGHDPSEVLQISEPDVREGLVIGTLDAVPYTTVRDGKTQSYLHEFGKSSRPLLVASSDGKRLRVVGGRFQFTEAGIEDRS
jgi:hypothetical protein